jgi:hypothetical protein
MSCTKWFALAAIAAAGFGCNPLTGVDEVDTDPNNPGPDDIDPTKIEKDAPASPLLSCAYPSVGSVGVAVDQILPGTMKWQGYAPGETTPRDISVAELFDCDGSHSINGHPVNAILFDTSQFG